MKLKTRSQRIYARIYEMMAHEILMLLWQMYIIFRLILFRRFPSTMIYFCVQLSVRFYCPSQNMDREQQRHTASEIKEAKDTAIITSSHEHARSHRNARRFIACIEWKRWIALRFIALIVDSIWWIYCISKSKQNFKTKSITIAKAMRIHRNPFFIDWCSETENHKTSENPNENAEDGKINVWVCVIMVVN